MFGWLRDALANTSPSLSYRHSMIPSPFFRQQQQQENRKKNSIFSQFDDEDETDEELNDNSFYHNPYHSSGQMNYVNVQQQQQYTNEHNYPTYHAQQQISNDTTNQSIDDQIHQKLISLQQRGNHLQSYTNKQYDYAPYKNQILKTSHLSFISNVNNEKTEEQSEEEEQEEQEEKEDEDYGMSVYYPGQYPNLDEHFDLASVVLWYRNVMQSVKKFM